MSSPPWYQFLAIAGALAGNLARQRATWRSVAASVSTTASRQLTAQPGGCRPRASDRDQGRSIRDPTSQIPSAEWSIPDEAWTGRRERDGAPSGGSARVLLELLDHPGEAVCELARIRPHAAVIGTQVADGPGPALNWGAHASAACTVPVRYVRDVPDQVQRESSQRATHRFVRNKAYGQDSN